MNSLRKIYLQTFFFTKIMIIAFFLFSPRESKAQCTPIYTDGSSLWYITQYKIHNVEKNDFSGFNDPTYWNYMNEIVEVMDQTSFEIEFTGAYDGQLGIWIDYNNNDIFETDELQADVYVTRDETYTKRIFLSQGVTGQRKIRLRYFDGSVWDAIASDPCASFENGMTIDHILNIEAFRERMPEAAIGTSFDQVQTSKNGFIRFLDESLYDATSWEWTFEGGFPSTSTEKNPLVRYDELGCFDVTLKATNALGSSTITEECYIEVISYCLPPDVEGSYSSDYYLHGVSLEGILNENINSSYDPGYTYFESSNADLSISTQYTIRLSTQSDIYVKAWIDFDQNNSFDDDEIIADYQASNGNQTVPVDFTVPTKAVTGQTRLRVRTDWLENEITPCEDHYGGEIEDYNVSIKLIPPVADFRTNNTTITTEDTIDFENLSSNQSSQWNWTFEGGNPSSSLEEDPQDIMFPNAGTYTVSLTSSNAAGQDTETKQDYITVVYVPSAQFSADKTTGISGEQINFTDESDNNPTSWNWFVDGTLFSNDQNPSDVYFNSPGKYTISLEVEGDPNTKLLRTKKNYIDISAPANIENQTINPINIFPNPNNGSFALVLRHLNNTNYNLSITDIQGRKIHSESFNTSSGNWNKRMDLPLETGIYFVQLNSNETRHTCKVIINR